VFTLMAMLLQLQFDDVSLYEVSIIRSNKAFQLTIVRGGFLDL
jgi:hypothetical protein